MEDEIKFSRAEILAAVAERIAAKKDSPVDGADDHEFVTDFYKACMTRARETRKDIFSVATDVVREDAKLGQRFLNYIFEDGDGRLKR